MKQVWSEENKYDKWLKVEIAACDAWAAIGVIPKKDAVSIRKASYDLKRIDEIFQRTKHDMTAFTRSVTQTLGESGRWIHMGLTSSDVMDTALSMQLMEAADILLADIKQVNAVLAKRAVEFKDTLQMGRTHGIHAEPITFGLKLALWLDEMRRNEQRLKQAKADISVGKISGAVGSHATVPPDVEEKTCAALGLRVEGVSNQVIQRDHHAQFVATLGVIAASIEKFATEIRGLQRTEVREVEEPFGEGQTGSSAMPHKRNPELSERLCGLSRLIRGHVVTALENVALWHERDISHSSAERIILPDSCLALDYMLVLFKDVISGMRVFPKRMIVNIESLNGVVFSQRVLLALIEKGMSREEAYGIVQASAHHALDEGLDFREQIKANKAVAAKLTAKELSALFDYAYYTRYVDDNFKRIGLT